MAKVTDKQVTDFLEACYKAGWIGGYSYEMAGPHVVLGELKDERCLDMLDQLKNWGVTYTIAQ